MRGQAYTLEGVVASVVILTALLYGLQVVDLGRWTSDTTEQSRELESKAKDVLDIAANNGTLRRAVTCYGSSAKSQFGGSIGTNETRRTTFEQLLKQTFDDRNTNYNIYFTYWNQSSGREQIRVSSAETNPVDSGAAPSESAAVATRTVTIYDDTATWFNGSSGRDCADRFAAAPTVEQFNDTYSAGFYMDDIAPDSPIYNIVEVRIVAW